MARKPNPTPTLTPPPGWTVAEAAELLRGIEGGLIRARAEQLALVNDRAIPDAPPGLNGLAAVHSLAATGNAICADYLRLVLQAEARFTLRCTEAIMGSQSATAIGTLLQRRDRDYALKPPTDGREVQHPTATMSLENILQSLSMAADADGKISVAELAALLENHR